MPKVDESDMSISSLIKRNECRKQFRVRMCNLSVVALLVSTLFPLALLAGETDPQCGQTHFDNARVEGLDPNYASLSFRDCVQNAPGAAAVCKCPITNVKVDNLGLRADLKPYRVGDHLRLDIKEDKDSKQLQDVRGAWSTEVPFAARLLVIAMCALALFALAIAVTKRHPLKFIVGMDNRYSNSKSQVALWFWVTISTYIAAVFLRVWCCGWDFFGGVSIPQNLLVLSGLSALTYVGAKAITTAKVNAASNQSQAVIGAVIPVPDAAPALVGAVITAANPDPKNSLQAGQERFFRDLVQNDVGGFDFGDFQMLVVTLLAVVMYVMLVFHFLGAIEFRSGIALPDVDTTVLAAFGLGQGAYLTKKAAGNLSTS